MDLLVIGRAIELKLRAPDLATQRADLIMAGRNIVKVIEVKGEVLW
jgi:hypothetical protein